MNTESLPKIKEMINNLNKIVEYDYKCLLDDLYKVVTYAFELLPFKKDDTVELIKAPNCNNGWRGYKDILIPGTIGVIDNVRIYNNEASYGFKINDTIFYLSADHLKICEEEPKFYLRYKLDFANIFIYIGKYRLTSEIDQAVIDTKINLTKLLNQYCPLVPVATWEFVEYKHEQK